MAKTKADLKKKQEGHASKDREYLKAAFLFCFLAIFLNFILLVISRRGYLFFFEIFTTKVAAALIQLSGIEASMEGNIIHLTNAVWMINTECTALTIMIIFASFVIAYPASLIAIDLGLLVGIPTIFGANILRFLIMAWIDKLKPEHSEYFHDYIWQVVFIIMVAFMWIVWIERVVNRETKASVSG